MKNFIENKTENLLVSVIIPCYNSGKTIEKTLASLENQSSYNFEAIIVNDGSTDNSDAVITNYIENSKLNINYIIKENGGVSKARNIGISNSKGKYIMFLDADDIYHKDCIRDMVSIIEDKDVDTIYCSYSRDVDKLFNDKSQNDNSNEYTHLNHDELLTNFMYRKGPCGFFNFIYKKSILEQFEILFTIGARYGEDLEFTWKYITHCNSGIFIDKPYYGYYDNPNSAVNTISWKITDVLDSTKRTEKYLKENKDEFYNVYNSYMYHRVIWSLLKDFSRAKNKELFERLIKEEDVKTSMNIMKNNGPNRIIKITAAIFCKSPYLFYNILKFI